MDYWEECISEAFEDAGIQATAAQIDTVASWIEGAHENYGMAHGHEHIANPLEADVRELERKLETEQRKIPCQQCGGRGSITTQGPYHSATSQCFKCRGEGRHLP